MMNEKRIGNNPQDWIHYTFDQDSINLMFTTSTNPFEEDVITGFGTIGQKKVFFYAQNPKVDRGFISSKGAEKIIAIMDEAEKNKAPIAAFLFSAGVSISEGINSGLHYAKIINKNISLSGKIPQFAVVIGTTMGAAAYSATLMDIVILNKSRSYLMVTSPNILEWSIGEKTTLAELGGSEVHSIKTGIADFVETNIPSQLDRLKDLIAIIPGNKIEEQDPIGAFPEVPEKFVAWNMEKSLIGLVDKSQYHLYKEHFGKSMLCAFARIGGVSVGILANQSTTNAGAIGVDTSIKSTRFLRICNAFNLPLITLIDVPGFMPGTKEEQNALLRHGANFCSAMVMDVPRISVVIRRCYGAAAFLMLQGSNSKKDLKISLPEARIAIMGYTAAKINIYQNDQRSEEEKMQDYLENYESPKVAKSLGLIDEIVESTNLRSKMKNHLIKNFNQNDLTFRHPILP